MGEMQQNAFLSLDFLQIETGTSLRRELNESAKKKDMHMHIGTMHPDPKSKSSRHMHMHIVPIVTRLDMIGTSDQEA